MPSKANFFLLFMRKFHIIGSGIQRITQSPIRLKKPLVNDTVLKALGTQWPSWSLFQKYETGVHSNVLAPKAPIVHSSVYTQIPHAKRRNVSVGNKRTYRRMMEDFKHKRQKGWNLWINQMDLAAC
jgi:hypothetical protein